MALPQFAELRLELETCCACGVEFAMPTAMKNRLRENHESFYCPSGHAQYYTAKSEAEKAREEVERLSRRLEFERNQTEAQRRRAEREERRAAAARGQTTKLRNRIARGQCPCCRQSFGDLRKHIAAEHPDYAGAAEREER